MIECYNISLGTVEGRTFQVDGRARVYVNIKVGGMAGWQLNVACAALEHLDGTDTVRVAGPQVLFRDADSGRLLRPVSPVYLKEGRERLTLVDERGEKAWHMWLSDLAEARI